MSASLAARLREAAEFLADDIPPGTPEIQDLEGDVRLDELDLYVVGLLRQAAEALQSSEIQTEQASSRDEPIPTNTETQLREDLSTLSKRLEEVEMERAHFAEWKARWAVKAKDLAALLEQERARTKEVVEAQTTTLLTIPTDYSGSITFTATRNQAPAVDASSFDNISSLSPEGTTP